MLTFSALLAAMTIAGAFWVGVLAARRLRDWGEGRRAIEDGHNPLALAASNGSVPDDARTRKIRALVAERLRQDRSARPTTGAVPRVTADPNAPDLDLGSLRTGDVVSVDVGDGMVDGDYIVEGLAHLREGGATTVVAMMEDAGRKRWLVGPPGAPWYVVEPVPGHGLVGEPPRNITRERGSYALQRRGQASAACTGRHERPDLPRVATYLYGAGGPAVLWLERWDTDVLMGEGRQVDPENVSFLPGS